jgi:excisionase family DNA binding protein
MEPTPKLLYSRAEAAEMLSLSVRTLDRLISNGMCRVKSKGRRILLHISEIERLAAKEVPRIRSSRTTIKEELNSQQLTLEP